MDITDDIKIIQDLVDWGLSPKRASNFFYKCSEKAPDYVGVRINQPKIGAVGVVETCSVHGIRGRQKSVIIQYAVTVKRDDGTTSGVTIVEKMPRTPKW
jgi:hypothetical protein